LEVTLLLKKYRKNLFIIIIGVLLVFSWFWTEGFGISPRYEYGNTIEKALNFWHQKNSTNIGLLKIVSTVQIQDNEKLVFFETTKNTIMCGLVKKKWNNKWIVIQQGGELQPDYKINQTQENLKSKPVLQWVWSNLNEFGITFGIVYDQSVETITVGKKNAILLNKHTDRYIWYYIDKTNHSNVDVKAYDKYNKLVYSYY
jgi:hypothetical protein